MRGSSRSRGMSLLEVLIALGVLGVVGLLVSRVFVQSNMFFKNTSRNSRSLGSSAVVLDKVSALCYGLPKAAITTVDRPEGQLLVIHPIDSISASGTPLFSDTRVVIETNQRGVYQWEIPKQERDLGTPLENFPPQSQEAKVVSLLGEGWKLEASFTKDRYPLKLSVTSPEREQAPFFRTLPGYL